MAIQWATLALPWQCCLEEAWTAYTMGSIPIGAAITDQARRVVARGRNRIFEDTAPGKLLCGNRLAHAEMNALIALEWQRVEARTHVLYTTTEPCALCIGALRMTGIGEVRYAARDAAAGSVALLDATPFMRRSGLRVAGPMDPDLETVIVALHVEYSLRTDQYGPSHWVYDAWSTTVPQGVDLGRELFQSGQLQRWQAEQRPIGQILEWLAAPTTCTLDEVGPSGCREPGSL